MCESILNALSSGFDLPRIKRNFGLNVTPLTIVLFQELERVNELIRMIRTTLIQLQNVIFVLEYFLFYFFPIFKMSIILFV